MASSARNLFGLPAEDLAHVLRHAENDLVSLRDARLFLTGGTGFYGKWLLSALTHADAELALGLEISVLSRHPAAFQHRHPEIALFRQVTFQEGDVATFTAGGRHDFILHAATDTTGIATPEQEAERERTILEGTRRVLDLARASQAKRTLLTSSGGVYGAAAGKPGGAKESDLPEPLTTYGRTKLATEKWGVASGLDVVITRGFAFLGPLLPLDAHYAAGNFLRDAIQGGPIRVRGDGTAQRSYLHPADLVIWLLRMLCRGESGRVYNVGSDEAVMTAQLARIISEACPSRPGVVVENQQPAGVANIYLPDISRARRELGLEIYLPLGEAVARTLQFLKPSSS